MKKKAGSVIAEYGLLTLATLIMVLGVYVFKFPNHFSFGGVTGIATILSGLFHLSAGNITFVINMALLAVGFLFIGKSFGLKTVYVSVLMSALLSLLEKVAPMAAPLTNEPVLELIFGIVLPSLGSGILFNMDASGGGTDIIAMVLRKYSSFNIGTALFFVDLIVAVSAFFVFDVQTGLFSFCGLMAKSLVIDGVIESINLCKYFTIICDDPAPICDYIKGKLNRSATTYRAEGAYSHRDKTVILTVMRRNQAMQLRNFVKRHEPTAFIAITNSSEIIGKGFRGFD